MQIGNRKIGSNHKPIVIAEIGINHGGNIDVAKHMVNLAAKSGCECIKHQTHFVEDEMTNEAKQIFPPNADTSIWDIISKCALSRDDEVILKKYTESLGMLYLSTPFSRTASDFLEEIGVLGFKIGSGESDNIALIRHIAKKGKPIIMSTGMQSINSIQKSVKILEDYNIDYALLECTNLYPSPPEIVSLQGINDIKQSFPKAVVGFSDHSIGSEMALASVALGACIIERHFTDTRYRKGPDIICSMDPTELSHLINRSEEIHTALHNKKHRTEPEEDVYRFARSSIVADKDLPHGHEITEQDIWARRPGTGEIPGFKFDEVIGKKLNRPVKHNEQLSWENFGD